MSVGTRLFLVFFLFLIFSFQIEIIPVKMLRPIGFSVFFGIWIFEYWLDKQGLDTFELKRQIKEDGMLIELSKEELMILIKWYAFWLALFTGSLGRWFDLVSFQIAGRFDDLKLFMQEHPELIKYCPVNVHDVGKILQKCTLGQEQAFKFYYAWTIKQKAFHYLFFIVIYHRLKHGKYAHMYVEGLLDRYGKHYVEYGIFMVSRMRSGDHVREIYEGVDNGNVQMKDYKPNPSTVKMKFSGSLYQLKSLLKSSAVQKKNPH